MCGVNKEGKPQKQIMWGRYDTEIFLGFCKLVYKAAKDHEARRKGLKKRVFQHDTPAAELPASEPVVAAPAAPVTPVAPVTPARRTRGRNARNLESFTPSSSSPLVPAPSPYMASPYQTAGPGPNMAAPTTPMARLSWNGPPHPGQYVPAANANTPSPFRGHGQNMAAINNFAGAPLGPPSFAQHHHPVTRGSANLAKRPHEVITIDDDDDDDDSEVGAVAVVSAPAAKRARHIYQSQAAHLDADGNIVFDTPNARRQSGPYPSPPADLPVFTNRPAPAQQRPHIAPAPYPINGTVQSAGNGSGMNGASSGPSSSGANVGQTQPPQLLPHLLKQCNDNKALQQKELKAFDQRPQVKDKADKVANLSQSRGKSNDPLEEALLQHSMMGWQLRIQKDSLVLLFNHAYARKIMCDKQRKYSLLPQHAPGSLVGVSEYLGDLDQRCEAERESLTAKIEKAVEQIKVIKARMEQLKLVKEQREQRDRKNAQQLAQQKAQRRAQQLLRGPLDIRMFY
ncbi:unnamed protein product [Discula destructiva]